MYQGKYRRFDGKWSKLKLFKSKQEAQTSLSNSAEGRDYRIYIYPLGEPVIQLLLVALFILAIIVAYRYYSTIPT